MSGSALAQTAPSNTNIAGPSASATGNVTNQAVQVLQGPYAMNTYGGGVSCQGATFSISPFVTGNNNSSADPEAFELKVVVMEYLLVSIFLLIIHY
jgi:hypothetical protein